MGGYLWSGAGFCTSTVRSFCKIQDVMFVYMYACISVNLLTCFCLFCCCWFVCRDRNHGDQFTQGAAHEMKCQCLREMRNGVTGLGRHAVISYSLCKLVSRTVCYICICFWSVAHEWPMGGPHLFAYVFHFRHISSLLSTLSSLLSTLSSLLSDQLLVTNFGIAPGQAFSLFSYQNPSWFFLLLLLLLLLLLPDQVYWCMRHVLRIPSRDNAAPTQGV